MGKLRPREEETGFLDYNPKSPEGTSKTSSSPTDALQQVSTQASSRSAQDGTIRPTLIARQTAGAGRCREVDTFHRRTGALVLRLSLVTFYFAKKTFETNHLHQLTQSFRKRKEASYGQKTYLNRKDGSAQEKDR